MYKYSFYNYSSAFLLINGYLLYFIAIQFKFSYYFLKLNKKHLVAIRPIAGIHYIG